MSGRVALLVIVCIVVSFCFGSPIKEEPNLNSNVVQLNVSKFICVFYNSAIKFF